MVFYFLVFLYGYFLVFFTWFSGVFHCFLRPFHDLRVFLSMVVWFFPHGFLGFFPWFYCVFLCVLMVFAMVF